VRANIVGTYAADVLGALAGAAASPSNGSSQRRARLAWLHAWALATSLRVQSELAPAWRSWHVAFQAMMIAMRKIDIARIEGAQRGVAVDA
jgi:hypothetical protein